MSSEPNLALDRLEAELFRDARLELEPDQARVDGIWGSIAAASTLGAAVSGVSASVPPASGTKWAAPRPVTTVPSAAVPDAALPSPTVSAPAPTTGTVPAHASFGLRALALAAVGGALLGFAAGYGAGGAQNAHEPPRATTTMSSKASDAVGGPSQVTEAADAPGAPDEPQARAVAPKSSAKPRAPSSSRPVAESAKPSFYEELEYLKRAQSALRQDNGALALGLMTELDSIQPGGALLSERGVTKVLAHCQLGDVDSAERIARRLAAQGLASVYLERLETSCAGSALSRP